jgi:putative SOS response-associated peptidase YedK
MCYNVQQKASLKELTKRFNAQFELPKLYTPLNEINGFTFPLLPVLISNEPTVFEFLNWGLIPHWAKDQQIRKHTLNAKLETINDKPSFRDAVENRCILPVTGFYEWKWLDFRGKRKEKYLIKIAKEPIFGLAGIHSSWTDGNTGEQRKTFSLLTTEANPTMAEIHNTKKRMPLMLTPEHCDEYLASGEINISDQLDTKIIENDGQLDLFE